MQRKSFSHPLPKLKVKAEGQRPCLVICMFFPLVLMKSDEERSGSVGRALNWVEESLETHRRRCIVSLSMALYPLLSIG